MNSLNDCFTLKNGVRIPCIGYGTWQMPDGDKTRKAVLAAIESGYRHIDTAAVYGNERSVGLAIRDSGICRQDIFVTTKLWNTERGYEATLRAFDQSMKLLGLDYCDLYLIHWPNPIGFRECWQQKNAESWRAMERLYAEGRIRSIGISNFRRHHIEALLQTANIMPMVNQLRLNPAERQIETTAYCQTLGMLLEAYSPLGTGNLLDQPEVLQIAQALNRSSAQILIRYSIQKGFLPLPKSVSAERIRTNTQVFDFALTDMDMESLESLEGRLGVSNNPDTTDF